MRMKKILIQWVHHCSILGLTTLAVEQSCKGCGCNFYDTPRRDVVEFNPDDYQPSSEFVRDQQAFLRNRHRVNNWKNKMKHIEEFNYV